VFNHTQVMATTYHPFLNDRKGDVKHSFYKWTGEV